MAGRKPKHDTRVLKFVAKQGPITQAAIAKALKIPAVSLYSVVKRMVEQGKVKMDGRLVVPLATEPVKPSAAEAKRIAEAHAKTEDAVDRIAMLKYEIDNITDGIRSLMISRSYLMRRVQEEQKDV